MTNQNKNQEEKSIQLHEKYQGKIATELKVPVKKIEDYSIWYTPGVAGPSKKISKEKEKVYQFTNKSNTVGIISDGSRVLGLGDIGPEASLPVIEGKSLLFKHLGGVDAYPLCLNAEDEEKFISTVKALEPSFGGINLEDIESPKCFEILKRLREELKIPVWHDDQQGTALVTVAGLLGALKVVEKDIEKIKIVIIGAGAAGINNAKYAIKAGAKSQKIKIADSKGILSTSRDDLNEDSYKFEWARKTNPENIEGSKEKAFKNADVCISASTPGPGIIKKDEIRKMAKDPIVFATANPTPEILPKEAKKAGAKIIGTGRSDYPNQINNSLGFPAIFRGALEVGAEDITDEMCIAVSKAISKRAEEIGLSKDFIIPDMNDQKMYIKGAIAAAKKAMEQNIARNELSKEKLRKKIRKKIENSKDTNKILRNNGII